MICWKCKKEISVSQVFRTTECPLCGADLHSCKGCAFYAPGNHFDCRETVEDLVSDKEKSNFCDYYKENSSLSAGSSGEDKAKAARDAFNSLFG